MYISNGSYLKPIVYYQTKIQRKFLKINIRIKKGYRKREDMYSKMY